MSVTFRYRHVCCKMNVFFRRFHKSIEVFSITVKLCFTETMLKKGYDLPGYFLKITRKTLKVLKIAVIIIFLNKHLLVAVVRRCCAKKVFLIFHKIYSKKPVPAACNFI